MIVCYIVPGSPFHKLLQTQDISVMGMRNLDIERVRISYPYVVMEDVDLAKALYDVPGSALKIMAKEKDTTLATMRMQVLDLLQTQEAFVTRIDDDPDMYDPSFVCYGDMSIEQKGLCNSRYDVIGNPKKQDTFWDRPCSSNNDCPFYRANKNYPNERGGCLPDGKCELPVGVKRLSYRFFDASGVNAPFCYGCKDPDDPGCCEKQGKSWGMLSPDYVFPADTDERTKANMELTTIGHIP
jgi:hypothetical protein